MGNGDSTSSGDGTERGEGTALVPGAALGLDDLVDQCVASATVAARGTGPGDGLARRGAFAYGAPNGAIRNGLAVADEHEGRD